MSKSLWAKFLVVGLLAVLLLVPLNMVGGLIGERQAHQQSVIQGVAQTTSGPQRLVGPAIVLPYKVRHVTEKEETIWVTCSTPFGEDPRLNRSMVAEATALCGSADKRAPNSTVGVTKKVFEESFTHSVIAVAPEQLNVGGAVATTAVYRGLYEALIFDADLVVSGHFAPKLKQLTDNKNVTFGAASVAVGVADVRGIRTSPQFRWQKQPLAVKAGNDFGPLGTGFTVPLTDFDPRAVGKYAFELKLNLIGTESLAVTPLGKETQVSLKGDWPHPSFGGRMLPSTRDVRDDGFDANWKTTWFATNLDRALRDGNAARLAGQDLNVRFIRPVDTYQQAWRSVDYGILFVLLTFTAFFLFEIVARLRIHPMQYSLVGAALASFYLLLIALSEHVDFASAYAIASAACVLLITVYLAAVMKRWRRGMSFGLLIGAQYGALYGVLQSEDHALLLGATLVFASLSGVMILTRRLDWYALGQSTTPTQPPATKPASPA